MTTIKAFLDGIETAIQEDGEIGKRERQSHLNQLERFKAMIKLYAEPDNDPIWCDLGSFTIGEDVILDHKWQNTFVAGVRRCVRCQAVEVKQVTHV